MESPVTQDIEGHSVWLPEIKMEPEDNDESASEPQVIEVEPTPPEFAFVKVEPMTEEPLNVQNQSEIENLHEPTSPPGTPTHSTTLDNITSQLDQVTHESSKTQLQFDFQQEVYVKQESLTNQCPICNKVFSHMTSLKRHLSIHSDKRDQRCDKCGKCFTSKGYLKKHKKRHNPPVFVCAHCDRTFAQRTGIAKHIKHQHMRKTRRVRFTCSICSRSYSDRSDLTRHAKTHNNQHCEICNVPFAGLTLLRTHMQVEHDGERNHRCKTCQKSFFTVEDLTGHEIHYCSKPFKCDYCHVRFLTTDRLELHLKNKHSKCDICSKTFKTKQQMLRHKLLHTEQEQE